MQDLSSFWSSIGLLAVLAILAVLWIAHRSTKPTKPNTPDVKPDEPIPLPAPSYHGFLSLKPLYQKGERLIFQTTRQVTQCGADVVSYGIDENNTGPYGVLLRAYVKETGETMPIYIHDGGAQCDGQWVPSGVFDVYLMGRRPYEQIGSVVGCTKFIPYKVELPVYVPAHGAAKGCNPPQPVPVPQPVPGKTVEVVIEVSVMNQYGSTSGPYSQVVMVDTTGCA